MSESLVKLSLKGLNCANCANKIEAKASSMDGVDEAILNFSLGMLSLKISDNNRKDEIINKVKNVVKTLEPDVVVSEYVEASKVKKEIQLSLAGLNCANCANKIETKVNEFEGVKEAVLNFSLQRLTITLTSKGEREEIISRTKALVNELEPDVVVSERKKASKAKVKKIDVYGLEHKKIHKKSVSEDMCTSECCSGHSHEHVEANKVENVEEEKQGFFKENKALIIGAIFYIAGLIIGDNSILGISAFLIGYLLVGGDVLLTAFKNIKRGEVFDENLLMTIATLGAILIGEYPEAIAVMLFYQIGELFQGYAVNYSRKSIKSLMNIKAEYANLITRTGEKKVSPEDIEVDDIIVIKPGERVPLDGIIIEGSGMIDTSALTGESLPRDVKVDDDILSGSINLDSVIKVRVTKTSDESTISRILDMVENASNKKAPTEKLITKFCKYYTPIVVFSAMGLLIIPPLLIKDALFSEWLYRALLFLVVSCPCALVVSVPLGLFAGIGAASRQGVLVKGGNYLEALKDVDTVVFDKTGTLTKGNFKVSAINTNGISKEELLETAAMGESFSNHPIAQSIVKEYGKDINKDYISNYRELSGHGVSVVIKGQEVLIGNLKLMLDNNIKCNEAEDVGTAVYVSINGQYRGNIIIQDEVKENSKAAIAKLKAIGVKKIVMLTGDNDKIAQTVGKNLGINHVYSKLLPLDKVTKVEELLADKGRKGKLAFVGDGINDAPVLARADIGIAMGGIGSDAAIEAADVVLMKDDPLSLVDAIRVGSRTNLILWQNIIFSLVVKVGVLILGALGFATMWSAVFADVGVTVLAVLNSMRALRKINN